MPEAQPARRSSGGETVEGFRVAYTPGHASPPRLLPRTRRPATPTSATWPACASRRASSRVAADAAARHRRRGLGALARDGRAPGTRAPVPHALRPRRRRRPRSSSALRGAAAHELPSAPGPAIASGSWPSWRPRSRPSRRRVRRAAAPGGAARAALAGPRALLAQARSERADRDQLGYPARTSNRALAGRTRSGRRGCSLDEPLAARPRAAAAAPRRGARSTRTTSRASPGQGVGTRAASTATSAGGRSRRRCWSR